MRLYLHLFQSKRVCSYSRSKRRRNVKKRECYARLSARITCSKTTADAGTVALVSYRLYEIEGEVVAYVPLIGVDGGQVRSVVAWPRHLAGPGNGSANSSAPHCWPPIA